jgi:hypothetical protein
MTHIRLTVRCTEVENHAKVLVIDAACLPPEFLGLNYAKVLAGLLDGSSPFYIYPPGPGSPIGKCGVCGGKLKCEVEEVEAKT